jgi:hypothetical protein
VRLSDEELGEIERAIHVHREVRNEGVWDTMPYVSPVRVATMAAMVTELKERRAADLSSEDREALEYARDVLNGKRYRETKDHWDAKGLALSVLDKLLAKAG